MLKSSLSLVLFFGSLVFGLSCSKNQNKYSDNKLSLPDSSYVLSFLTTRDGNFEVYSMTANGKNVVNLSNNKALDFWSSWSPDGKFILFYSNRDGNNEIYRMDADGKNQTNISNHPSNDYLPCWSPDGKYILFTSDRDNKNREVYLMQNDGSNVVRLTDNEDFEEVPSWSPDGTKILFTRQISEIEDTLKTSNGELFLMDRDGKNVKRLTNRKGYDSGGGFRQMDKKLLFMVREDGNFEIFLMNSVAQVSKI
ncbi:MAG: PD40 domain-containing protein [Cytophagaceae bacterium]|nr:PD40 domain-containing protein [Cytophagaceae bacterium]